MALFCTSFCDCGDSCVNGEVVVLEGEKSLIAINFIHIQNKKYYGRNV